MDGILGVGRRKTIAGYSRDAVTVSRAVEGGSPFYNVDVPLPAQTRCPDLRSELGSFKIAAEERRQPQTGI